jgi:CheY-like chemotaxis protein
MSEQHHIRILDIGQCGFDGPRMSALWHKTIHAAVDRVASADEAIEHLARARYDLILVNRILAADGASGLDVIRRLKESEISTPVMLVSDRTSAQEEAVALGALRGFGKAELNEESTWKRVLEGAGRKITQG